jgi:branched-chain amino acid transport system ATP-binding protein
MITLSNLTVQLGGVKALEQITTSLDAPVHGVIGPNGAGKTTLLNALSGFVLATSGAITVDSVPIHAMTPRARAVWGIRRTFQTERLAPRLTGRENVAVAADHAVSRRGRRHAVDRALEFVGLDDVDNAAASMDGFSRRLAELARAVVGEPKVVLLDEPAGGLSQEESGQLQQIISRIPDTFGAQVLLVDHDVDLISRACSRVTVLDFGHLLITGETGEVLRDPRVRAAWLGTAEVAA